MYDDYDSSLAYTMIQIDTVVIPTVYDYKII